LINAVNGPPACAQTSRFAMSGDAGVLVMSIPKMRLPTQLPGTTLP
jgi:hypothetical protein